MQQRFAIAPLQLPKQRTACSSASLSHPPNLPNSDRTPSTPQTAISPFQLPKQRSHSLQLPKHPFLTNHRDAEDTEREIAPFNSPNSDRTLQPPKQRSHPLNFPISFLNEPRRREEHEGRKEERAIA
ncbi:hypothetical protein [Anabaena sp. WA102]|uniref:hypothetical protein n=1 Tax=Anabaena sp. WA102 TaxID=1647413 RepID=UPI0018FFBCD0|nr:hypothetical protein [Anabaena sp. WA102]